MSGIFDVEPPRWLQAIAQPINTKLTGQVISQAIGGAIGAGPRADENVQTGTSPEGQPTYGERGGSWFSNFLGAAAEAKMSMADPLWRLKANELQVNTLKDMVGIATADTALKMHRMTLANTAHDVSVWPKWLADNRGNYLQAPPPDLLTPEYNTQYTTLLGRETQLANNRVTSLGVQNFYARLKALPVTMQQGITLPDVSSPTFQQDLQKATQQLDERERQAGLNNPLWNRPTTSGSGAGSPGGLGLTRIAGKDQYGNEIVYSTPTAQPGTGSAIAAFQHRLTVMRENDPELYKKYAYITTLPANDEVLRQFGEDEAAMNATFHAAIPTPGTLPPGSTLVENYSAGGVKTASLTSHAAAGPPPAVIQTETGSVWAPIPVLSGNVVTGYSYKEMKNTQDRLTTASQYTVMARDLTDQITGGGTAFADPKKKAEITAQRDSYLDIANRLVKSQEPAINALIAQRKQGGAFRPYMQMPAGTNAPAGGGKVFNFDASGNLQQ